MTLYPKSDQSDIIYFELNNWSCGRDYPDAEPYISWMGNDLNINFRSEKWTKENKLVVVASVVDMSSNFCISAKRDWVEKNCPSLLNEFKEFQRFPDEGSDRVFGRFDCPFLPYEEENIGSHFALEKEDSQGFLYYEIEE